MSPRLIQRHDQFAKQMLDLPGHADAFLRERLPADVVSRLTEAPAVDRSESFIDPLLAERRGDRVYALETLDGDPILVWTSVEHKSSPDPDSLVQSLGQLAGIACRGARERRNPDGTVWRVPAVVYPIILYHGVRRWPFPTELAEAYHLPPGLSRAGLLSFVYTLVYLLEISDGALSKQPSLRAALMVLKYALQDKDAQQTLERLVASAVHLGLTTAVLVVRYLVKGSDWIDREKLHAALSKLLPDQEDSIMTPMMQEIIDEARPRIIDEARPRIIDEARPRIIDEVRPRIVAQARAEMLLRQLRRKFGPLPADRVVQVESATVEALDAWSDSIVFAESLDDVLGVDPGGGPYRTD